MVKKSGLTYRSKELAGLLIDAGIPKNVALSLVFLLKEREANSSAIEKATGLRQPEVSIAMQKLRTWGWVEKKDIKREGKGRPTHSYTLNVKPARIIRNIEEQELKKIRDIRENLSELKKLLR